jgi:metal iron transporter
MPHSLYVGSSLVHARLREFDIKEDLYVESDRESTASVLWRPSYKSIKATLGYTFIELCITVFVIAVFVNSAILVIAAAKLPESAQDADLFGMYALIQNNISKGAATIFAVGLLFSGTSAGIVATMAGQIVMEGALNIRINPFVRRIVTRLIAIIPAMIIAAAVGPKGLGEALNACNVVLSIGLIFLVAPIVWYTSRSQYMTVVVSDRPQTRINTKTSPNPNRDIETEENDANHVDFANSWINIFWAVVTWLLIVILNVAAIVLLGLGKGDDD